MVDILASNKRSALMARVRTRHTGPERNVRSCLRKLGLRCRLHSGELPGTPDIVLPKHGIAMFVHGCFWHRHLNCKKTTTPKTRFAFWVKKFRANVARDKRAQRRLRSLGWSVITVWECQTEDPEGLIGLLCRKLRRAGVSSSKINK